MSAGKVGSDGGEGRCGSMSAKRHLGLMPAECKEDREPSSQLSHHLAVIWGVSSLLGVSVF